jgi:hypothetical protein
MQLHKFGLFADVFAIASALIALFGFLLLRMIGRTSSWTWLTSSTPSFLVSAGARALTVALMGGTYVLITPSNCLWFVLAAVIAGLVAFFATLSFDKLRRVHISSIPLVAIDGSQSKSDAGKPLFENVVIGLETNMRPEARQALDVARARVGGVSMKTFLAGYGANKVNDPEALWDAALLANIGRKITGRLMAIFLAGIMALFWAAFGIVACKTPPPSTEAVQVRVPKSHFVKQGNNSKLIIFVHGVLGDMDNTWLNEATNTSWPQLMAQDSSFADYDVFVYGYYSPKVGKASDIYEIATRAGTQLHDAGFFEKYNEIDFITHSMGGIITKRMLDDLNTPSSFADLQKVHSVIYMSVPAHGANLADLASWISENPQFSSMSAEESNNFLQAVEGDWRKVLNQRSAEHPFPRTFSAYEKLSVGPAKVVPELYTSGMADGPIQAFDYNHIEIVKPDSLTNDVYEWARARILESSKISPQPGSADLKVPPIAVPGAAIGTMYDYTSQDPGSIQCRGEFIKVSASTWYERHVPQDPPQCLVNAVIFTYTERESPDKTYILLYDAGRKLFARLTNTPIGEASPNEWRLISGVDWNVSRMIVRRQ